MVFLRISVGWTFLFAGLSQITDPQFSVVPFLTHTKTFHALLVPFAAPAVAPIITFLVEWGHTLIGLSLISGLLVRASASCGIALMLMYWAGHMDFPYIENVHNFLIDYHIIYPGVLAYLIVNRAGQVCGLDGFVANLPFVAHHPRLRPLVG